MVVWWHNGLGVGPRFAIKTSQVQLLVAARNDSGQVVHILVTRPKQHNLVSVDKLSVWHRKRHVFVTDFSGPATHGLKAYERDVSTRLYSSGVWHPFTLTCPVHIRLLHSVSTYKVRKN